MVNIKIRLVILFAAKIEKHYTVSKKKKKKKTPGAECGSHPYCQIQTYIEKSGENH